MSNISMKKIGILTLILGAMLSLACMVEDEKRASTGNKSLYENIEEETAAEAATAAAAAEETAAPETAGTGTETIVDNPGGNASNNTGSPQKILNIPPSPLALIAQSKQTTVKALK
ncbi:hypothetical protein WDW89_04350 [Deltaproteobacteria bacterium TL4]